MDDQNLIDWYVPDPADAEPSPVPGLSIAEYEEIAEKLLWYAQLTVNEKIRAWEEEMDLQERFRRFRTACDAA